MTERNFCPRCGKRLGQNDWDIHTCTPPQLKEQEPVAIVWHKGYPPFPQDQEWFIAETIYGDRVVLRSLDEGREHKGNYAFTTADSTYMKAEIVRRWMQFPDCNYIPPQRTWVGLTDEEKQEWIDAMPYDPQPRHCMILVNIMEAKLKEKNT